MWLTLGEKNLKCGGDCYIGLYVIFDVFLGKVGEKRVSSAKRMTTSRLGHVSLGRWVSQITSVMGLNDLSSMGGLFIPRWPLG